MLDACRGGFRARQAGLPLSGGCQSAPPREGQREQASCGQCFQRLIPAPICTRLPTLNRVAP